MTDATYRSPPLRITARIANHARAGMQHAATAVFHEAGHFTAVQVEALKRDPNLVVDEATVDGKVPFDPAKTEDLLKQHFEADPEGLRAVLHRVFPGLFPERLNTETFVTQFGAGGQPGSASVGVEELPPAAAVGLAAGAAGAMIFGAEGDVPAAAGPSSGVEQPVVRLAHAQEVAGSSPAPAPNDPPPAPPPADTATPRAVRGKGAQEAAS